MIEFRKNLMNQELPQTFEHMLKQITPPKGKNSLKITISGDILVTLCP